MKDIVVDTNAMRLYPKPKDPAFVGFFKWLRETGTLTLSKKLEVEYVGSGNAHISIFIDELRRKPGRLNVIRAEAIKSFEQDEHFNYTCNHKDIWHARTVFLSCRKKLVMAGDQKLCDDINKFPKVDGIKPEAARNPAANFYI